MRVLDLFCGAGGFSEGFRQAGFEVVAGVDNWVRVLQTFKRNHPGSSPIYADLRRWQPNGIDVDVVIGGPPCPEFSVAKEKSKRDPEKGMELVRAFFRIVDDLKPQYWCIENVPGARQYIDPLVKTRHGRSRVLCAADYGVPQTRYRFFGMNFPLPTPTHTEDLTWTLDGQRKKWVSVWEAIGDLLSDSASRMGDGFNIGGSRSVNKPSYTLRGSGTTHYLSVHAPEGERKYGLDKPSPTIMDLSKGGPSVGRPRIVERPSLTVTGTNPYLMRGERKRVDGKAVLTSINERRERPLTVRESARLQSFSDDFVFVGNKGERSLLVGNAVPPLLARAIAEAIP